MSSSIIKQFVRDVSKAFMSGATMFNSFGKVFRLEHVSHTEWRVTNEGGEDIGLRFIAANGKLSFTVA